jgi:hypothetical protein
VTKSVAEVDLPSVLLFHGAWHRPDHFRLLVDELSDIDAQLGYQSYASKQQPLTQAAWQTIPSTYVICEADKAIPVATQELFAQRADDVQRLSSSHSPFLSQPADLACLIRRSLGGSDD